MIIATPEEMVAYGKQIGEKYNFVLLDGELGAGKTHFVKGFAAAKGVDSNEINSPTYTYLHEHGNTLLHMDMYRIEDPEFLMHKGLLEKIHSYPSVIIEWPRFTEQYADHTRAHIHITKTSPTQREVILNLKA